MRTVFVGLWRRLRPILLLAVVGTVAAFALVWLADTQGLRPRDRDNSGDFMVALLILGVSGLVGATGVLLANSDSERIELALPQRVLRMPLRTWKLAFVHMAFGMTAAASIALIATLPAFVVLEVSFPWWVPAIASVMLMPLIQVWAYAMGNTGVRAVLISFVLYFGAIAWAIQRPALMNQINGGSPVVNGFLVVAILLAVFGAMCAALRVQRRGGWSASFLTPAVIAAVAPRARNAFRSNSAAQFWYEWRQFGLLLPVYVGGAAVAYFFGMPLVVGLFRATNVTGRSSSEPIFRIDWFSNAQYIWMGLVLSALVGGLMVGGVMFMRGGHWNSASSYLLTRPLTLARISNARLAVVGTGALLALAELVAATLAIEGLVRLQGETTGLAFFLHQGYERLPAPLTLVMHFGFLLVLMWACAWPASFVGVAASFVAPALGVLGVAWGAALAGVFDAEAMNARIAAWMPVANWVSAGVVVLGLLSVAWRANGRGLIHPALPTLCAALWLAYSWAFAHTMSGWEVLPGAQSWYSRFPHPINWPLWVGLSCVPLLPFFLHPLMLARIRNR